VGTVDATSEGGRGEDTECSEETKIRSPEGEEPKVPSQLQGLAFSVSRPDSTPSSSHPTKTTNGDSEGRARVSCCTRYACKQRPPDRSGRRVEAMMAAAWLASWLLSPCSTVQ